MVPWTPGGVELVHHPDGADLRRHSGTGRARGIRAGLRDQRAPGEQAVPARPAVPTARCPPGRSWPSLTRTYRCRARREAQVTPGDLAATGRPDVLDGPFTTPQLLRLDEALRLADRSTGLTFSIYVGTLDEPAR